MAGETQSGMACPEFERLLSEALDGAFPAVKMQAFRAHGAECVVCGPLLSDAEAGRGWLKTLAEVDPPANLVSNILMATIGISTKRSGAVIATQTAWWEQIAETFISPVVAVLRQPRFVMSFGMAFFAVSICLSLAGIRLSDLHTADLRPSTIKRNYYETSGRVVKYYENIRFVYELESRAQEFKRVISPEEPAREEEKNKEHKNDTSGRPDPKQDRNYSQGDAVPTLALLPEPVSAGARQPRRAL